MDIIIPFIGGLGMFIYGMQIMAQGLENAAGSKMKKLLEVLTKNKLCGVLLGAGITAVIQSSSATTVMVVGFVNAKIMDLYQAMSVIMGANIGTTVTGWLVSSVEWAKYLSPTMLAPIAIMVGVIFMLVGKKHTTKEVSRILIGFGLLFVGITTMSSAVYPLRESEVFCQLFVTLGKNPLFGILAGAIVTAIIQSSSASVGILQSLAAAGLVPFSAAIYIIMGQNIGTCITAILSGLGANRNAKTASLMHLLFNVIGTFIFSTVAILYLSILQPAWASGNISQTQISLIHTIFNIATTIMLFPVSNWIIKLAMKLGRVEQEEDEDVRLLLDERMLETPSIAIQTMQMEVQRMSELVKKNLEYTKKLISNDKDKLISKILENEKMINTMTGEINSYILKLTSIQLGEKEHLDITHILQVICDLERIGDHCQNIAERSNQLLEEKITLTDEVKTKLITMMDICQDCYEQALLAYETQEYSYMIKSIEQESYVDTLEAQMRMDNVEDMTNKKYSMQAGIIIQDILINMERISDHARNIAENKMKKKERLISE